MRIHSPAPADWCGAAELVGPTKGLRLFDDIPLERRGQRQHFVLFLGRNVELVERGDEQLDRCVPVLFGDAKSRVRGLRVAADVDARPARGKAELVDDKLADPLERIGAVTDEEAGQARIAGE